MSNRVNIEPSLNYPPYETENVKRIIRFIAEHATDNDLIAIIISSHGYPGGVRNKVGIAKDRALSARELKDLIAPISNKQVIIIISSCYSGSLINELQGEQTVILTASSAKKTSFGCDQHSKNTWFVKSLKNSMLSLQFTNERFSLVRWFNNARQFVLEN